MPSPKKHELIETMQAIAWCAEVQNISGLSPAKLEKQCIDASRASGYEFSMYARGERIPKDETIGLIEDRYPGTKEVFELGPDKRPLWGLLADECDEDLCLETLDGWLFDEINQRDVASVPKAELDSIISQFKSMSLQVKTDLAWKKMLGPNEVDFDLFDSGMELNRMWKPASDLDAFLNELEASGIQIEKPLNIDALLDSPLLEENQKDELESLSARFDARAPKLEDVIGIIALRRLAESRSECQSEARYLFLGSLPFINGIFSEWNIVSHLDKFLSSWSNVPTSPVTIASSNPLRAKIIRTLRTASSEKNSAKEAKVVTTMLKRLKR